MGHLDSLQIEKSCGFKSGNYGGRSARIQNYTSNSWVVWLCWPALNPPPQKAYFLHQDTSLDPGHHTLPQRLLVIVGIETLASGNRLRQPKSARPVLILLHLFFPPLSCGIRPVMSFSNIFHNENQVFAVAEVLKNLRIYVLSHAEL
jgi:hypothetical protein